MTASLLAYPDPKIGGGYFLLLAGLPAKAPRDDGDGQPAVKREVTLVIDRSGSMQGEKLKQAQAAALQVIEGLEDGEAFNVIDYSDSIASFAPAPVAEDQAEHRGGAALHPPPGGRRAARTSTTPCWKPCVPKPADGMLPHRAVPDRRAAHGRRARRGADPHGRDQGQRPPAPHLHLRRGLRRERPAAEPPGPEQPRRSSTFVLPNEEIEAKVSQVYRRLFGPVLAEPELTLLDADGEPTTRRVADLLPGTLPDLFEGDQLVLLGKYTGEEPLQFRSAGLLPAASRGRSSSSSSSTRPPRGTASCRGCGPAARSRVLVDEIRQAGAAPGETRLRARRQPPPPIRS